MPTWSELRKNALTLLDVNASATTASDLRVAVDLRMQQSRDRLYSIRCPESLVAISSDVTVTSTTTALSIPNASAGTIPGFNLSSSVIKKPLALTIDGEAWTYNSYLSWVGVNSSNAGNQRWYKSWTLYQKSTISLRTYPSSPTTWIANLVYMQQPAAISDDVEPELEDEFQELLVSDVVRGMPNRFISEERVAMLAEISARYKELLMLFKSTPYVGKLNLQMKPFVRNPTVRSLVNWGTGDL